MTTSTTVFNPFSAEFFEDPYPIYRKLRDHTPVYYSPEHDFYALSRHADVALGFKDFATFSSARGVTLEEIHSGEVAHGQSMIWMDPPEHRRMRSLVNKVFTPRAIKALENVVRDRIEFHLSRVDPAGFDVVADFSAFFPVEVISTMLGVPEADRQQVRILIDKFLERKPGEAGKSSDGAEAMVQAGMFFYQLVLERRAEPRDDMISALIAAQVDRDDGGATKLDDNEIVSFCLLLGGAGAETVTKLIGNAMVVFAEYPDQWRQLREDRSKIPAAVEEALRYVGPVQYDCRYTLAPVSLHDTTIPAGSAVMLLGASANRDERAFTDAEEFDINRDRAEAQNLGFGYGIHSCLGAALARMESALALEGLLQLLPAFEVDQANLRRVAMTSVGGYSHVPVRATAPT
ncbi:cytochrome P450 [Mycolicibacterium flavescens]|uniref:Steroid C26-monooxygenase n=1 Tax=Mycolicibacterium flavescens TaxID=1776 RepID=A0A1E3RQB2_MYCFV|nr:cytochrome P450 [Mycolicibacterium flavescens]MCV7279339.1 cytochrome P450 [Mycolicibacterium flavescens]ODQ92044.1 cytochrome [Mycolicibacterium flavescens]